MNEFAALDATAQAELVQRGDVAPIELVEAAIARIEQLNPQLNAVITPLFDQARAQALDPHLPDGPFRGVPFLLKDYYCEIANTPYYEGMRFLRDLGWQSAHDTYLGEKFRAAGFIFLGKTNLPELALSAITDHPECVAAVKETGQQLESVGHHVVESFPLQLEGPTGLGPALRIISASGLAAQLDEWSTRTGHTVGPDDVEPATWARGEEGR